MGFSRNDCIGLLEVLDERGVGSAADHRLEKVLYGRENAHFSSLQPLGAKDTIPSLEKGPCRLRLGADNLPCPKCRSVLGSYERKRIRSRTAPRPACVVARSEERRVGKECRSRW